MSESHVPYGVASRGQIVVAPGTLLQFIRGEHIGSFAVFCGRANDKLTVYHQPLNRAAVVELEVDQADVVPVGRPHLLLHRLFPDTKPVKEEV